MPTPKRTRNPGVVLNHRRYCEAKSALRAVIEADESGLVCLLGPTRCGKTMLLQRLHEEISGTPESAGGLFRGAGVVRGSVPDVPNARLLTGAMLKACGYDFRRGETREELHGRLVQMIARDGVRVIALDEISHAAERGAQFPARAAADCLKSVIDETGVLIVGVGLPRFQSIIDGNEQLRARACRTISLRPHDWRISEDRRDIHRCLCALLKEAGDAGLRVELDSRDALRRLYGVTGGRVGQMLEIVGRARGRVHATGVLDAAALEAAALALSQPSRCTERFFAPDPPDDEMLVLACAEVMTEAGVAYEQTALERMAPLEPGRAA